MLKRRQIKAEYNAKVQREQMDRVRSPSSYPRAITPIPNFRGALSRVSLALVTRLERGLLRVIGGVNKPRVKLTSNFMYLTASRGLSRPDAALAPLTGVVVNQTDELNDATLRH